ncbi:MAG: hypothetical protein ACYTXI_07180 [Nostoc sp.]
MTEISDPYNLNVKYLKLVNYTHENRQEWSYKVSRNGEEFYLHWPLNKNARETMNLEEKNKKLLEKKRDAKKALLGERILLCQNHATYGHRVTHIVETVTDTPELNELNDKMWTRRVRLVWMSTTPWENNAPNTNDVIRCNKRLPFRSGNLIRSNAPSIRSLNLDQLI